MKVIMQMIGRMLCKLGLHKWHRIVGGEPETLGFKFVCDRCDACGQSHVGDHGDIEVTHNGVIK